MFCIYCGNQLPDNAKFCPNCGNAVDRAPSFGAVTRPKPTPVANSSVKPTQVQNSGISHKLTINRASQFFAINPPMKIYIDAANLYSVENGGTVTVELPEGVHSIRIISSIRKKEIEVDLRADMVLSLSWDRVTGVIRADLSENINSPTVAKEPKAKDNSLQASVPMQRPESEKCWLSISRELQPEHGSDPMAIRIDGTKQCNMAAGEYTELELKKGHHTIQVLLTRHQTTVQISLERDSVLYLCWSEPHQEIEVFFSALDDEE